MSNKIKKNIFAYSGSGNKLSTCTTLIKKIIAQVETDLADSIEIHSFVHTPNNTEIINCCGCNQCFLAGKCSMDNKDDMKIIKEEMLNADLIIFATPVYVNNVTGDFKIFMDRLAYWTHLFRLLGKPVYHVISTSNSGIEVVQNILDSFSLYLGLNLLGVAILSGQNDYYNPQFTEHCDIVKNALLEKRSKCFGPDMNRAFLAQKIIFQQYDEKSPEYQYWKLNGFFELETLDEVLE